MHHFEAGSGPAFVLVHGNPSWAFLWRDLIGACRGVRRCLAPDHLGCGLSDNPPGHPMTLASRIDDLEAWWRAQGEPEFDLAVHDWGGPTGLGLAARHPDAVRRIVILNTAAFTDARIPFRIAVCRTPLLGALLLRGLNAFSRAAVSMAVERPLPPVVRAGFLAPYGSWARRRAVWRFVRDIPMRPAHPSWPALRAVEEALPALASKPALLVWGGRDFCFSPHFHRRWRNLWPHAEDAFFPDAGHWVLEDAGPAATARIRSFLA